MDPYRQEGCCGATVSQPLGLYTCAICKEEWNSSLSEEEAAAEYARNFPEEAAANEPHDTVCDVCFKRYFGWTE